MPPSHAARAASTPRPSEPGSIHILLVDDDASFLEGCASVLRLAGYQVTACARGDDALQLARRRAFDIVLVGLDLPGAPGLRILEAAVETSRDTIAVVMTARPDLETSIEARRLGAWDYLVKPFSTTHLEVLLGRAAHAIAVAREREEQRERLVRENGHSDKVLLLGRSPAFQAAVALARRVAPTNASVMLVGESGTGKEVLAQFIHSHSRRAAREMVAVNCAALPEPLLESEMFGHRKGAFTGADREKRGLLETADGGTLFLDELTDMPSALQAKLLRVIQDGVVRRVGSEGRDAVVDVRFVSAANRDPREAVERGILRKDLFYRLRVVPIRLPPLRERPEDIAVLARHFLAHYWARHRGGEGPAPELTEESLRFLRSRPWPGNVRELQNTIEHLAVLADAGALVHPHDIPIEDEHASGSALSAAPSLGALLDEPYHVAKERLIGQFEQSYLRHLVLRAAGNMSKAARLARVDRTTLYRLLERHESAPGTRSNGASAIGGGAASASAEEREVPIVAEPERGDPHRAPLGA